MKFNKTLFGIIMMMVLAIIPMAFAEESLDTTSEPTIEEVLSLEEEIPTETLTELSEEVDSAKSLPSGFSRFLSGIGDAFTLNKTEKALRAMERVKENKLRVIKMMQEKQSGLYNTDKFSAELEKLQKYIETDSIKVEKALNSASENGNEKDFNEIGKIQERIREQSALDKMIGNEAKNTASKSKDLSSKEMEMLRKTESNSIENTKRIKVKATEKEVKIAAKMIAAGVDSEKLKEMTQKYAENKERVRTMVQENRDNAMGNGSMNRIREEIKANGTKPVTGSENKPEDSGSNSAKNETETSSNAPETTSETDAVKGKN